MFRLVADITELNIDQVKLPKIPGLGMLMKLLLQTGYGVWRNSTDHSSIRQLRWWTGSGSSTF